MVGSGETNGLLDRQVVNLSTSELAESSSRALGRLVVDTVDTINDGAVGSPATITSDQPEAKQCMCTKCSQGRTIGERPGEVARNVGDLDDLGPGRADGDELEREVVLVGEAGTSEVTEPLREIVAGDTVTAVDAVNPGTMVEVVTRLGAGDVVDVGVGGDALDLEDLGTSETLPVEVQLVGVAEEVGAELSDELNRVGDDVDVLDTMLLKTRDRCQEKVLEVGVAVREPTYGSDQFEKIDHESIMGLRVCPSFNWLVKSYKSLLKS